MAIRLSFKGLRAEQKWERLLSKLPIFTMFAAILFEVMPIGLDGFNFVRPHIALAALFFWAVYFPESMGFLSVFFMGMFNDLLTMNVFGLNAFLFLFLYVLVLKAYKYLARWSYGMVWLSFSLAAFFLLLLKWALVAVESDDFPEIWPSLVSASILVMCYPVLSYFLGRLNFYLIEKEINVR